jgi:hypothetical protein
MIDHLRQEVLSMVKNSFNEENAYLKKYLRHVICKGQEEQENIHIKKVDRDIYTLCTGIAAVRNNYILYTYTQV